MAKTIITALDKVNYPALAWAQAFTPNGEHASVVDDDDLPAIRMGKPTLFVGGAGAGKTAMLHALAKAMQANHHFFSAGNADAKMGNVPVPNMEKKVNEFFAGDWMPGLEEGGRAGMLVLDDLTCFTPSQQGALLDMFQFGKCGDGLLGPRCRTFAGANSPKDAPGGWGLAKPLRNRMCIVRWSDPAVQKWANFNLTAGLVSKAARTARAEGEGWGFKKVDAFDEEQRVLDEWDAAWRWAAGYVNGFVLARKAELEKYYRNEPEEVEDMEPWCSPRSLTDGATSSLATKIVHNLDDTTTFALMSGCVGEPWAIEFMNWIINADLPNIEVLLDTITKEGIDSTAVKNLFEHKPSRMDRTVTLIGQGIGHIEPEDAPKRNQRTKAFWQLLHACGDSVLDYVADIVEGKLFHAGLSSPKRYPESVPVMKRVKLLLKVQ